jgi:hypothetical protein
MSRYVIWTEDENLEVFVGFDEGLEKFFLTIADGRTCTGESGSYLFHNMDDHRAVGMTVEEVAATLVRFGLTPPPDLLEQLKKDARLDGRTAPPASCGSSRERRPGGLIRVLGWQCAL